MSRWAPALGLCACLSVGVITQVAVSLSNRHWTSYNRVSLANDAQGGLSFVFPTSAYESIGYLYTTRGPSVLSGTLTLRMRVDTIGFPTFRYDTEPGNTCVTPATVRPFFGRYVQKLKKLDYANRWWPRDDALELQAGGGVLAVPLNEVGAVWVKVFEWQQFEQDRQDVDLLGLSFGGGCFYAHGVYVTGGEASFTVVEMTIS